MACRTPMTRMTTGTSRYWVYALVGAPPPMIWQWWDTLIVCGGVLMLIDLLIDR